MDAPPYGPAAALDAAFSALARATPLRPFDVDEALLERRGAYAGRPVTIRTRASSSDKLWLSRFTLLEGESLRVASVVCFPRPEWPAPIFGADWVSARPDRVMLALDASPTLPNGAGPAPNVDFAEARARHRRLESSGPLPPFCRDLFSPHHLFAHVPPSRSGELFAAFMDFFSCWVAALASASPSAATAPLVAARVEAYSRAHREDDRFLGLLGRAFGGALARRLIHELLFPSPSLREDAPPPTGADPDRTPR